MYASGLFHVLYVLHIFWPLSSEWPLYPPRLFVCVLNLWVKFGANVIIPWRSWTFQSENAGCFVLVNIHCCYKKLRITISSRNDRLCIQTGNLAGSAWLSGSLAGYTWLPGWLAAWLSVWLAACLFGCLPDCLFCWLPDCLAVYYVCLTNHNTQEVKNERFLISTRQNHVQMFSIRCL